MSKIMKFSAEEAKKIFFTSDTHFCHNNIIKFCKRPYKNTTEMDDDLIKKWNEKVHTDGIVFHLGDFCFAGSDKWFNIRHKLNGHIYLIRGNHDDHNMSQVMEKLFDGVYYQMRLQIEDNTIYLNHYPFLCFAGTYRSKPNVWQLFGHVHSGPNSNGQDDKRLQYLFPTQYDVGVDNNGYYPISYEEVKTKILGSNV